jgi:tetratricopeptide (TPR) repeat protein
MPDPTQVEIATYLERAKLSAQQSQWAQTIATCQQIIDICRLHLSTPEAKTTTPETQLHLGDLALAENNLEVAIDLYRQAVSLAPYLPQAHQKLADALSQNGLWAEATPYYRRAIELKQAPLSQVKAVSIPPSYATYKANGELLQARGETAAAIKQYLQAIALKSDNAELFVNLGNLYVKQQQWQLAIDSYQKALKVEPKLAGGCRNLAKIYERLGQAQLAADYWYRALSLEPSWGKISDYFNLANTLYLQHKLEPAIDCYLQAISLNPNFIEVYIQLAKIFRTLKQFDRAWVIARQLAAKYPQQPEVQIYCGQLYEAQQQWQEAETAYRQSIELRSDFWEAYKYLAELKVALELWQEAVNICQQALAIKPDISWIYYDLGYASFKLQLWEQSETAFREAIRLNPNFVWSYVYLGEVFSLNGKYLQAIDLFLRAIELQNDLPGIYKQLGIALYRQFLAQASDFAATASSVESIIPWQPQQTTEFYRQTAKYLQEYRQDIGTIIFYNLALKLSPQNQTISLELQQAQERSRQLELKIADFREKIRQNNQKSWIYSQLANVLADRGESEAAIALNRQASVLQGWHLALQQRNYQFQYDWFTHNLPIWQQQLQPWYARAIQVLEIGSFEGMATCWLLDYVLTHPNAGITCIDLYFQNNFARNIAQTQSESKVTKISGDSHQILGTLPVNSYDIIYIDGCHLAEHVKQDAILSWKLLKNRGLLIFDDYLLEEPNHPEQNTKLGVDDFLASITNRYQICHQGYQLLIEKIS